MSDDQADRQSRTAASRGGRIRRHLPLESEEIGGTRVIRALSRQFTKKQKLLTLAVASILTHEVPALSAVDRVIEIALLFYAIYWFAPSALPGEFEPITKNVGFRALAASTTIVFTRIYSPATGGWLSLVVFYFVSAVVVEQYAARVDDERYPEHFYRWMIRALVQSQSESEKSSEIEEWVTVRRGEAGTWFGSLMVFVERALVSLGLLLPFFVLGVFVAAFGLVYPIPELLAVGWVGGSRFLRGFDRYETVDIEQPIYTVLSTDISNSLKAFTALIATGSGFFFHATIFSIFAYGVVPIFDVLGPAIHLSPLRSTLIFAFGTSLALTLLLFPVYGLWFWRRELKRLPAFLSYWEWRHSEPRREEDRPKCQTSRPPGLLLPSSVLLLTLPLALVVTEVPDALGDAEVTIAGYLIVWLLAAGLMVWSIRWPYQNEAQPPRTEQWSIPTSHVIQGLAVGIAITGMMSVVQWEPGTGMVIATQTLYPILTFSTVGLLGAVIFFIGDVVAYPLDHDGLVDWPLLLIGGGITGWLFLLGTILSSGALVRMSGLLLIATIGSVVLIAMFKRKAAEYGFET